MQRACACACASARKHTTSAFFLSHSLALVPTLHSVRHSGDCERVVHLHSVCVCVCWRKQESERKRGEKRERDRGSAYVSACLFVFVCIVIAMVRLETLLDPTEDCGRVFELKVSASVSGCGLSSFQLLLKAPLCLNEPLTLAPNQYQPNSLKNHRWNWPYCSVLSVPRDLCVCVRACVCVCARVHVCVIAASLLFPLWPASNKL